MVYTDLKNNHLLENTKFRPVTKQLTDCDIIDVDLWSQKHNPSAFRLESPDSDIEDVTELHYKAPTVLGKQKSNTFLMSHLTSDEEDNSPINPSKRIKSSRTDVHEGQEETTIPSPSSHFGMHPHH